MGFFEDVGNFFSAVGDAIAGGAEAAGEVVETGANAAGEFVADIIETGGNALQDGLNALGDWAGGIPFVGGLLEGTAAWLGGIIAGATNFIGAVVKAITGIIGGVIGGLIKVIGGLITFHWDLVLQGLIDMATTILGALIAIGGTLLSLGQRLVPFINQDRALTKEEKDILRLVFKRSLALYNIRIKSNSGAPTSHFTLNNTIYSNVPDLDIPQHTLVHECVHVWQYQNLGSRYLAEALGAQWIYGRSAGTCVAGDAYDWIGEVNRGNTPWEKFNREAQAQLITEIWTDGTMTNQGMTSTAKGAFFTKESCEAMMAILVAAGPTQPSPCDEEFIASALPEVLPDGTFIHCPRDGNDYTGLAIDAVRKLQGAWNFRVSQII